MQDTKIIPNWHAYSLRVDQQPEEYGKNNSELLIQEYKKFLAKYSPIVGEIKYLCYIEQSKVVHKIHIQSIIWVKDKLPQKKMVGMRQWFRRPQGAISFTSAKNVKSLAAYCSKDNGYHITNLDQEQQDRLTTWENYQLAWDKLLRKWLKESVSCYQTMSEYTCNMIDFYVKNQRAPPQRSVIYRNLLKYHPHFDSQKYMEHMNIFPIENNF